MSSSALLDQAPLVQAPEPQSEHPLTASILEHINEQAVIGLDTVVCLLPQYSWNQIFQAVDDLARRRLIVLRRHGFEYTLFSAHYAA